MKLFKDSLIYLLGELLAKAWPFLLLPYLTRKLGTAGFGELSYFQTICSLLMIVFGLSQDGAVTRYYYVYGQRMLPQLIKAGWFYTALCTLVAFGLAWYQQSLILASVVGAAATQTILGVQLALRQCQKRALSYTAIQLASGVGTSLLTVLFLETTTYFPVAMRFVALLVGNVLVSLVAYYWAKQSLLPTSGSLKTFRLSLAYILAFGLPLLLHHFSGFAKGQFDRLLIFHRFQAAELGIYSAGYQLATILSILLLALNKATVPYFYQALKQGSLKAHQVRRWSWFALALAPLPALAVSMLPERVFLWFLGQQYGGVKYFVVMFLLGFGLTIPYFLLVNFLFYHGQNKRIALISVLSTIVYLVVLAVMAQMRLLNLMPLAMVAGNVAILPLLYYCVHDKAA